MIPSAYQLRDFYKTLGGRIVRRLIREKIVALWPELKGLHILGGGYAVPYLASFTAEAERTICVMFREEGVHHWPDDAPNLTCLADETDLPFETNSVDRILLIHSLEFTGLSSPVMKEFWRILKSNGRILVVVPNRIGLWARADLTPFGRGTPYSSGQVQDFLKENLFVPEKTLGALYIPPFKSQTLLRSAGMWERVGEKLFPAMGGLIFVEASKQIYAGVGRVRGQGSRVPAEATIPVSPEPEAI
ncbi:MAG: methyltransferase type 11 [Micavibrio aeruginosavorus]|uniref:Methyltransferase type 11 n=1 Tax=Micavibrio aeruginosavorus TaxID=349221 RepID=A0A2W5MXU9_9BACT|nr:MAG: methyltransferase type 11 [Micavibrio aeruginosavorus]